MRRRRRSRAVATARVAVGAGALAAMLLGASALTVAPTTNADGTSGATGAVYQPIDPCRAVDTRNTARPGPRTTLPVSLDGCALPARAVAVAVTLTAVSPDRPGYATVHPSGAALPPTSTVNWSEPGAVIANSAIIPVPTGAISVFASSAVDLVVDVNGYFVATDATAPREGRFVGLDVPVRVIDTRRTARPTPSSTTTVELSPELVPGDAIAALVTVTATESVGPSYVTAWASGARPRASILNLDQPGQTRAATALVELDTRRLELYSHAGDQLVVDLIGYVTGPEAAAATDGLFVPLNPSRRLDTRRSGGPIHADGTIEAADVTGAVFVGNLTMTETTRPGYLRVLPARSGHAETSSVNADARGATVANLLVSSVSPAGLAISSKHQSDAVLDQTGYFTGVQRPATHAPGANLRPAEPTYPSAACTAWDTRLDYGRRTGVPAARETRQIGTSVQGRPIWAEYYGPLRPVATVLVVTGVHGDECGPALIADATRRIGAAGGGVGYWLVAALNPDGMSSFSRANANGVDLNRDGFRVTQPESQALMLFTAEVRPTLTLYAHSPYGFVGGYGSDSLGHDLAAAIADRTGMTHARSAGSKPGAEFLWEGQSFIHRHAAMLVELFPLRGDEGTVDRPRLRARTLAEVADDANQTLALIDARLRHG